LPEVPSAGPDMQGGFNSYIPDYKRELLEMLRGYSY
jgi:hypothetical protein